MCAPNQPAIPPTNQTKPKPTEPNPQPSPTPKYGTLMNRKAKGHLPTPRPTKAPCTSTTPEQPKYKSCLQPIGTQDISFPVHLRYFLHPSWSAPRPLFVDYKCRSEHLCFGYASRPAT